MLLTPGRGGEANLDRDGVKPLHLLGGKAGRLRGDFDDHRRRVGIGLDIELRERNGACDDEGKQHQHDNRPAREPKRDESP